MNKFNKYNKFFKGISQALNEPNQLKNIGYKDK